ncbi:hypothetical protein K491DRAFT_699211 [Lophiostoma macrostomum CBS 122681]|uniref:Uncharacterized protein n=1 Tax=Lophiostoma macrostomum CBS 122681 TaxID=1314788 RepID=A0A6A6SJY1_9PLEO|nr:hypothetical protein K491DRAFT_699211 [Lophiostoma macrostomum CBS 122681]
MPNHGSFLGIPRELRDLIYPYLNKTISAYKTDAGVPIKIQKVPLTSMQLVSQQMRAEYLASKPHDDITLVVLMNIFRLGHGRVAPPICATGLPGDKSLDRNSFIAVFKQARHLEVVVAVEGGASAHWDDRFFELLFYGYEGVWDLDSTSAWELQTMKVAVHHHFHMVDMQRADGAEAVLDVPVTDLRDLELRQHACAYHHQPAPFDVELKTRVYLYGMLVGTGCLLSRRLQSLTEFLVQRRTTRRLRSTSGRRRRHLRCSLGSAWMIGRRCFRTATWMMGRPC